MNQCLKTCLQSNKKGIYMNNSTKICFGICLIVTTCAIVSTLSGFHTTVLNEAETERYAVLMQQLADGVELDNCTYGEFWKLHDRVVGFDLNNFIIGSSSLGCVILSAFGLRKIWRM